ncbi:MAG: hypothetical protein HQL07_00440 [Nitrospirae bacterium]|nr:hypothetical protein [Magnetococcales bacterium]
MSEIKRIRVTVGQQPIQVTVKEESIKVTSPVGLSGGWPFGENPKRVEGIIQNVPTILDRLEMPGNYRVVKWLLLLADDANGVGVGSEINAFIRGGVVEFTEYAILGDYQVINYDLDLVIDGNFVQLLVTSQYSGTLEAKTVKIGIFS